MTNDAEIILVFFILY